MNNRIRTLREQSLNAIPAISLERATLLTEFYKTGIAERVSVPVARALAFKHILQNKEICINDGELIVGERGPAPKATPTSSTAAIASLPKGRLRALTAPRGTTDSLVRGTHYGWTV